MKPLMHIVTALFAGGLLMNIVRAAEQGEGYYQFPEESPKTKYVPSLKEGQTEAGYYRDELDNLYKLDSFKAMKNSYVLGLETFCNLPRIIPDGGRYTLLDVEGQGSLRHIWETRGPDTAEFEFEMFVDGEKTPGIKGRFEDLIAAAQRARQPYVLNPGGTIPKQSHNFYLPVPFEKSLRIDIANLQHADGLVFLQLDYRLEDDSMKGVKLVQKGEDSRITLTYEGSKQPAASPTIKTQASQHIIKGNGEFTVEGPAIIRKFALYHTCTGVRMNVFFDDEPTPAIEVDMADFFGPFKGSAFGGKACYLPMPFAKKMRVVVFGASDEDEWNFDIESEPVPAMEKGWGYFHARSEHLSGASGYDQFQVLNTTGHGKWIGMSLYNTQHDHGGGDFAVIDGGTAKPSFLHGINGEDYFSFAFFGQGENFPYSEAFANDVGRMRLHLENPYVFNESISLSWGVTKGVNPRSVAYWYQEDAKSKVLSAEQARGLKWKVFGPVGVPVLTDGNTPDTSDAEKLFAALPPEADLDAGKPFDAQHIMFSKTNTGLFNGWAEQYAIGSHLNLMYIYGHAMDLHDHMHMGYYARCMMAKTEFTVDKAQRVKLQLSYDDPLVVEVNGKKVFEDMELRRGFTTQAFDSILKEGQNKIVVRMLDTPNNNTCWAGISLRVLDAQGNEIGLVR
ncbi:MAG: DUF2961 domain-containing protein [Verrucomicrobiota bacterium]